MGYILYSVLLPKNNSGVVATDMPILYCAESFKFSEKRLRCKIKNICLYRFHQQFVSFNFTETHTVSE